MIRIFLISNNDKSRKQPWTITLALMLAFFPINFSNTNLLVTLISFTASPMGEQIKLNWSTSAEINNNYFTIHRSKATVFRKAFSRSRLQKSLKLFLTRRRLIKIILPEYLIPCWWRSALTGSRPILLLVPQSVLKDLSHFLHPCK